LGGFLILGLIDAQELLFQKHGLIEPFIENGQSGQNIVLLLALFALHQDEPLVAVKDLREFIVVLLPCLSEFFFADLVQRIKEVLLHMEVIQNDQSILCECLGG